MSINRTFFAWGSIEIDLSFVVQPNSRFNALPGLVSFPNKVILSENQTSTTFQLTILTNAIPTLNQTFSIFMSSPNGSAVINPLQNTLNFTIAAHNNPNGLFQFDPSSLNLSANLSSANQTIQLIVQRTLGLYDTQILTITVTGNSRAGPSSLQLVFAENQTSANFNVTIAASTTPQLQSMTLVTIKSIYGGGAIGLSPVASIITAEHDHPNGVVQFLSSANLSAPISVGSVNFSLSRSFGLFGPVNISWVANSLPGPANSINLATSGIVQFSVWLLTLILHLFIVYRRPDNKLLA